jgi:hypothetical protein
MYVEVSRNAGTPNHPFQTMSENDEIGAPFGHVSENVVFLVYHII